MPRCLLQRCLGLRLSVGLVAVNLVFEPQPSYWTFMSK